MKTKYNKAKVIPLPTNKPADIYEFKGKLYQDEHYADVRNESWVIYVISETDEIREGDLVVPIRHEEGYNIQIADKGNARLYNESDNYFKCIATTNKIYNLPQPTDKWVKYFIDEYNKGNIIVDVLVEYEVGYTRTSTIKLNGEPEIQFLKTNLNNCINIKTIKNTFTREDMLSFAVLVNDDAHSPNPKGIYIELLDKWIENNL
jgi:hypothetical protein